MYRVESNESYQPILILQAEFLFDRLAYEALGPPVLHIGLLAVVLFLSVEGGIIAVGLLLLLQLGSVVHLL